VQSFNASWGAVILAGGASRRMGHDKALLDWGGRRAIDRMVDLVQAAGVRTFFVAGGDYGWPFVTDPHPQAGPCAGVAAGARLLREHGCTRMIVLAVDAPTVSLADLQPLMTHSQGATYVGFPLPFAASIDALPLDMPSDMPLRRLVEGMELVELTPSEGLMRRIRGANTPEERAALLNEDAAPKDEAPGARS
jgi:molybdopterin-guanine dinucleotide biosynthesis protein A